MSASIINVYAKKKVKIHMDNAALKQVVMVRTAVHPQEALMVDVSTQFATSISFISCFY